MSIKLIVGLGNPGPQYQDTRHNAGAWLVYQLATHCQKALKIDTKFKSLSTQIQLGHYTCRLAIPITYMNLSGDSVLALSQFYNITPNEILVAHDDLDLPVGTIRLKLDGGHGGHNGLRDIFTKLGTRTFYRLRIGIGHPGHKDGVTNYVLHKPSIDEKKHILEALDSALEILPLILQGEWNQATKLLHTKQ